MSEIKIELKRTGFPVKIGEVELWFDTSQESLMRFYDLEEEIQKIEEQKEKAPCPI